MENGFLKKAKQGLMEFRELKTKSRSRKLLFFLANPVFGREREEKRGEELGLEEDQVLVRFLPIFLLLCDQAT